MDRDAVHRFAWALLTLTLIVAGCRQPAVSPELRINVFNPHAEQWVDAPVSLRLESYAIEPAPHVRIFREYGDDRMEIPSQLDDLDADGTADRLFFLVNLDAHETARYVIIPDSIAPSYPRRAGAQLRDDVVDIAQALRRVDFQSETDSASSIPGFELASDRAAYQTTGGAYDRAVAMNRATALIPDGVTGEFAARLSPSGSSIGLGMPALATRTGFVPCTDAAEVTRVVVADGPLRAIVRTSSFQIAADSAVYDVTTEHEIHAGSPWVETRLRIADSLGTRQVVTGIPRIPAGRLETGSLQGRFFLYTSGSLGNGADSLGVAMLVPSRLYPRLQPANPSDHRIQFSVENEAAVYRYMAAWSGDQEGVVPLSEARMREAIRLQTSRWALPVQVSIRR